jgi:AraC family transcriptional regulator of adaptative response / DNA-3-methyladenine glycosylase II
MSLLLSPYKGSINLELITHINVRKRLVFITLYCYDEFCLKNEMRDTINSERDKALYAAFKSKDSRFDGRFFVGVTSTGIYCRPVCGARLPKEENCVYFYTAAEAEKAGFRPCLTCRPELAPGMAITDAKAALAKRAARYIEENCGNSMNLNELASKLGYTDRHLRRAFAEEYHVAPVEYVKTCRLLLAKSLLTDTDLNVVDVAMAAGFGSLRRFNDLFKMQYRLSPTGFRKQTKKEKAKDAGVTVALGYHPPYEWERILNFLSLRAIPGVEAVIDNEYLRTVRLNDKSGTAKCGWIKIGNRPEKNVLSVTLSESLLPVLPRLLGRIRNLFDLYCNPYAVSEVLSTMDTVKPGAFVAGIRVPGCIDPFELCVRAVLGQQITVKAAGTLAGKMAVTYGTPIQTDIDGLHTLFPTPNDIASLDGKIEEHLGQLGIIASRARTILALAHLFSKNQLDCELCLDPENEMKKLTQIPGLGPWTAKYIAMRALKWADAILETDLGLKKALGGMPPKQLLALSEQWKPWRSYATMALWDSLNTDRKED